MTYANAAWILTATLMLTACGATPHHRVNHVAATQISHTVQFERNAAWPTTPEENRLHEFLSSLPPLATEEIVVEGRLGQRQTDVRLQSIRLALLEKHFPQEAINIVNSSEMPADLMTITITTGHVIPPADCPDWSDWPANNFNNHTYSNFGCATTVNLGQQVAHPYDLLRGAENDGLPDGERNSVAIKLWRSNAPTATESANSGSQDAGFSGETSGGGEGSAGQ